jgi:hypothetical protein
MAYSGGWKKFEPMWDLVIKAKRVANLLPALETILAGFGKYWTTFDQSSQVLPAKVRSQSSTLESPSD